MAFPGSVFTVVEDNKCPYYDLGDKFYLSGISLLASHEDEKEFVTTSIVKLPVGKKTCRVLSGDLTRILIKYERTSRIPETHFGCSGCKGSILMLYEKSEQAAVSLPRREIAGNVREMVELLSEFSIFKKLSKDNLYELVTLLRLKKFSEGEFVIKKGEPGKDLFIVLTGTVEVLDEFGNLITKLESGEIFGEMSLISGEAVGANIKTLSPVSVLYIPGREFIKTLNKFPRLQMYFARLLAQRLARANMDRTEDFSSGMIGRLSEVPQAELFQTLHVNQKTGVLTMNFENESATFSFRDGGLVKANFGTKEGKDAFFEVFKMKDGRFKFAPGLPESDKELPEIGFFMQLLMDGVRMIDEDSELEKAE